MRQYYEPLFTFIFVAIFIIASGLLLGTLDATEPPDRESLERIGAECVPRGPKPICPNLNSCPLDAAK